MPPRGKRKADGASGDADSRPECKYGAACYRTNPAHVSEFRHPKRATSAASSSSTAAGARLVSATAASAGDGVSFGIETVPLSPAAAYSPLVHELQSVLPSDASHVFPIGVIELIRAYARSLLLVTANLDVFDVFASAGRAVNDPVGHSLYPLPSGFVRSMGEECSAMNAIVPIPNTRLVCLLSDDGMIHVYNDSTCTLHARYRVEAGSGHTVLLSGEWIPDRTPERANRTKGTARHWPGWLAVNFHHSPDVQLYRIRRTATGTAASAAAARTKDADLPLTPPDVVLPGGSFQFPDYLKRTIAAEIAKKEKNRAATRAKDEKANKNGPNRKRPFDADADDDANDNPLTVVADSVCVVPPGTVISTAGATLDRTTTLVAVRYYDGRIAYWNVATRKCVLIIASHLQIDDVYFVRTRDPAGTTTLAVTSSETRPADGLIVYSVWDTAQLMQLMDGSTFDANPKFVVRRLLTTADDAPVCCWAPVGRLSAPQPLVPLVVRPIEDDPALAAKPISAAAAWPASATSSGAAAASGDPPSVDGSGIVAPSRQAISLIAVKAVIDRASGTGGGGGSDGDDADDSAPNAVRVDMVTYRFKTGAANTSANAKQTVFEPFSFKPELLIEQFTAPPARLLPPAVASASTASGKSKAARGGGGRKKAEPDDSGSASNSDDSDSDSDSNRDGGGFDGIPFEHTDTESAFLAAFDTAATAASPVAVAAPPSILSSVTSLAALRFLRASDEKKSLIQVWQLYPLARRRLIATIRHSSHPNPYITFLIRLIYRET